MHDVTPPRCLAFVAPSGTGKTTLLEDVIRRLTERGVRLVVLKASHEDHRLDLPGKDSWRFQRAGARLVGLFGPGVTTLFLEAGHHRDWPGAHSAALWLAACPFLTVDLVLCEGFAFDRQVPKLRVVRGPWPPGMPEAGDLVAVAWDGAGRPAGLDPGVALLPLEGGAVADWIRAWAADR